MAGKKRSMAGHTQTTSHIHTQARMYLPTGSNLCYYWLTWFFISDRIVQMKLSSNQTLRTCALSFPLRSSSPVFHTRQLPALHVECCFKLFEMTIWRSTLISLLNLNNISISNPQIYERSTVCCCMFILLWQKKKKKRLQRICTRQQILFKALASVWPSVLLSINDKWKMASYCQKQQWSKPNIGTCSFLTPYQSSSHHLSTLSLFSLDRSQRTMFVHITNHTNSQQRPLHHELLWDLKGSFFVMSVGEVQPDVYNSLGRFECVVQQRWPHLLPTSLAVKPIFPFSIR